MRYTAAAKLLDVAAAGDGEVRALAQTALRVFEQADAGVPSKEAIEAARGTSGPPPLVAALERAAIANMGRWSSDVRRAVRAALAYLEPLFVDVLGLGELDQRVPPDEFTGVAARLGFMVDYAARAPDELAASGVPSCPRCASDRFRARSEPAWTKWFVERECLACAYRRCHIEDTAVTIGSWKPTTGIAAPSGFAAIAGGRYRIGLDATDVRALAAESAAVARARGTSDIGEAEDITEKSGNPAWLEARLRLLAPAREVDLEPYAIAVAPVTNADFRLFMAATGALAPSAWRSPLGRRDDDPALGVSWRAAEAYARWIGAKLPSEAEWERAARGAERRLFPWGDRYHPTGKLLDDQDYMTPWVAGTFPSLRSPDGCFDMVTRRWEWCEDRFAPTAGVAEQRVRKGGETEHVIASAIAREGGDPDVRNASVAFRLALR